MSDKIKEKHDYQGTITIYIEPTKLDLFSSFSFPRECDLIFPATDSNSKQVNKENIKKQK